jgi:hypothetical protein
MMAILWGCFVLGREARGQEDAQRETMLQRRTQLRVDVQEICPVTGEKLGSMGKPITVVIGKQKETVFLCCKGCAKGKLDPTHWATIHANIARAQGNCPIMKQPLPKKSTWTMVQGQLVYVCCPPCIKKIEARPDESLAQVDAYYTAYLEKKKQQEQTPEHSAR